MKPFADLHHHTENSLLDGLGSIDRHARRCVELGHTAIALTEHGTCRGFVGLDAAAKEHGLKPIYGIEAYVCRDHKRQGLSDEQVASVTAGLKGREATKAARVLEDAEGIRERRHLVLLAGSDEGVLNLIRLSNAANVDGFYRSPRIDLNLLREHSEGLFCNSGCLGGVLAQSFLEGDLPRMMEDLQTFRDIFGDRFSLEIQPHPIAEQERWNRAVVKLSAAFGIPIVATNDSHYPSPDDWRTHDALVCVGHGDQVVDCDRLRYEAETFGLKSAADMAEAFDRVHPAIPRSVVDAAIERAAEIAERCNGKLWKPSGVLLPKQRTAKGKAAEAPIDALRADCEKGLTWRGVSGPEYRARLDHELDVIGGKDFAPYFLIVREALGWAREQGILTGPGRGSAAGSLVCYLLGITSLDPLRHGLLFERFLTPGRADWPDIDCDVEDRRRPEVLQHLRDVYGEDSVALISTVSRMRARAAFRDVARAFGVSGPVVEALTSAIVDDKTRTDVAESHDTLSGAVASTPALAAFAAENPDLMSHAIALEGHVRHVGVHPSGVVTSPVPLATFVPLERRTSKGEVFTVVAYDMRDAETVGLIKLDVLGLRTLSVLADCVRAVERRQGVKLDLEALPLDHAEVFEAFTNGDLAGVFQFDSATARAACDGVVFESFEDLVALNALNRPGPAKSGLADEWRGVKAGRAKASKHPLVEAICSDTLGVIVYQEHVIRILQEVAGYSPEEAGRLRKAISKSKGVGYLEVERPVFIAGAAARGMAKAEADALWTQIEEFGAYGFNKSHSAAYALIAYWGQWLKLNHPVEFFAGLLANEPDSDVANRYVREASRRGIKILPPDVNASAVGWTAKGSALLCGLSAIKRCGDKACSEIVSKAPFADASDFLTRINRRVVNKGVIEALTKAGALASILPNVKDTLENLEAILKAPSRKGWVEHLRLAVEASKSKPDFDAEDLWALRIEVGVNSDGRHPIGCVKGLFESQLRPGFVPLSLAVDGSWIAGVIAGVKVGTSGGSRWAAIEIEDEVGDRVKLRFGDEEYNAAREVLDSGIGTVVASNLSVNKFGTVKAVVLIDLLDFRRRRREGVDLTEEQALVSSAFHPLRSVTTELREKWWTKAGAPVLILSANKRVDKSGRPFAFLRVDPGVGDTSEVLVFADVFASSRKLLREGEVVSLSAKREKSGALIASRITKVAT